MDKVLTRFTASITELKKNPSALIKESGGDPIAILNHNRPSAYLVPADTFEAMIDLLEDIELGNIIEERKDEMAEAVEVKLDEL